LGEAPVGVGDGCREEIREVPVDLGGLLVREEIAVVDQVEDEAGSVLLGVELEIELGERLAGHERLEEQAGQRVSGWGRAAGTGLAGGAARAGCAAPAVGVARAVGATRACRAARSVRVPGSGRA